jgi:hypothetical protein
MKFVAEFSLDLVMLQGVLSKNGRAPAPPGDLLSARGYRLGQRRACHMAMPVASFRYQSTQEPKTALRRLHSHREMFTRDFQFAFRFDRQPANDCLGSHRPGHAGGY